MGRAGEGGQLVKTWVSKTGASRSGGPPEKTPPKRPITKENQENTVRNTTKTRKSRAERGNLGNKLETLGRKKWYFLIFGGSVVVVGRVLPQM